MRRRLWGCEVRDDLPQPATTCHDLRPVVCCHNTDSTARLHVFSYDEIPGVFCVSWSLFWGGNFCIMPFLSWEQIIVFFFFGFIRMKDWNMLLVFWFSSRVLWSPYNINLSRGGGRLTFRWNFSGHSVMCICCLSPVITFSRNYYMSFWVELA